MMNFFENNNFVSPNGVNLNDLNVDEAYFNLTSFFNSRIGVYSLSSDCKRCPFTYVTSLNKSKIVSVSTKHHMKWRFYNETQSSALKQILDKESLICELNESIEEYGIYDIAITKDSCKFSTQREPVNIYWPLCATLVFLLFLHLFIKLAWNISRRYFSKKRKIAEDEVDIDDNLPAKKTRISSIDVFRGFALCLMVFTNDGGGQYWFFNHSTWNGLYPPDLLYPWFLWIMGVCIALSQSSHRKNAVKKKTIIWTTLKRSFILFVIGLALNTLGVGPVELRHLRIPGILQRIAISYGITSILAIFVFDINISWLNGIKSILMVLPQWFFHLAIVAAHTYLTFYLPVPGCPLGFLDPGGIQDGSKYKNCTGGAAGYIDRLLLGENRLWQNAPVRITYQTSPFDPENILGCLTSIFGTFLGVQAGYILIVHRKPITRIRHFVTWAILLLALGFGLHFFDVIPINKSLWSLSFTLATSGLAFLLFAFIYYVVDYTKLWNGSPFIYPGMNSILVYVGHEICFQLFPWHWRISFAMNTHFMNLIENTWGVILWILITFCMYKKKIFVVV
ncbi:heparan-alpha-glucosaminide N-acetyltransferase-like [Planococcus citri]|uniref:heparan-alpha-glucosaminide N-acetyltransferase-like n=1 Tax=Planococcus citri TaxID=170843 RepID=UPI0031FA12F8